MSPTPPRPRRLRLGSALAASALAVGLLPALAGPAAADADIQRISGANRYETGVLVSQFTHPDPAEVDTVYVATGGDFPDALAAGAAAAALGGPVVLTPSTSLADVARDEIRRLDPSRIVLVGGVGALSDDVRTALEADEQIDATIERLGGANRYATAANVTLDAFPSGVETVYVATGSNFPDALSGVPAAARYDGALLLVTTDSIPSATAEALAALAPERIVILGGTGAVSMGVEFDLDDYASDVDRLSGPNRYLTAIDVAQDGFSGARTVFVATGTSFPDALTGGPSAAAFAGPLLLTSPSSLSDDVASELLRLNPRRVVILGGVGAVSDAVRDRIAAILADSTALPSGTVPDLAYNSVDNNRNGAQTTNVGTLDGAYEVLTNPPTDLAELGAIFSPNGARIAFQRGDRGFFGVTNTDIYVIDVAVGAGSTRGLLDTEKLEPDAGCDVAELDWRADGGQLAFVCTGRSNDEGSLPNTAYVLDLDGSTRLIPTGGTEDAEYLSLEYAPTGTDLALTRADGTNADDAQKSTIQVIDTADLEAGPSTAVSVAPDGFILPYLGQLLWSDDASTFVAGEGGSSANIHVYEADTGSGGPVLAEAEEGRHTLSALSADGSRVLVVTAPAFDAPDGTEDVLRLFDTGSGAVTATLVAQGDLVHAEIYGADLSPDGTIAAYGDVAEDGSEGNVTLVDADGTNRRTLFEEDNVINAFPTFNPTVD